MIQGPYTTCYCSHCRKRYSEETGWSELSRIVDWHNPEWVGFQRRRETWLAETAEELRHTLKTAKPTASCALQTASWSVGWNNAFTNAYIRQTDYASGDFGSDPIFQSVTCKVFYHLTENKPFEFMTARGPNLLQHVTMKPKQLLKAQAFASLANHGSFLWIDTMDARGSFNPRTFTIAGELFSELRSYDPYINLNAEFCHDAVIYMSFESQISFKRNGEMNGYGLMDGEYMQGILQLSRTLIYANVPYGIITERNLHELSKYPVVMLPDQLLMSEEEASAFRAYVADGGCLYASKGTSLVNLEGKKQSDFMLADVFGVNYCGEETVEPTTYIAPTDEYEELFAPYDTEYPLTLFSSQLKVNTMSGTVVLGKIQLPLMKPFDPLGFAACVTRAASVQCP